MAEHLGDRIVFSTGRVERIDSSSGAIGLTPDLSLDPTLSEEWRGEQLTPQERIEVADLMIGLWQQYRQRAEEQKG